jgi:hypothetical protein
VHTVHDAAGCPLDGQLCVLLLQHVADLLLSCELALAGVTEHAGWATAAG